ncbi:unnamed protein product [Pylaiella littoralis]
MSSQTFPPCLGPRRCCRCPRPHHQHHALVTPLHCRRYIRSPPSPPLSHIAALSWYSFPISSLKNSAVHLRYKSCEKKVHARSEIDEALPRSSLLVYLRPWLRNRLLDGTIPLCILDRTVFSPVVSVRF